MNPDLLREYCDAYVLGALEGKELTELQALIDQGDSAALAALAESAELAAQIATATAADVEPPALLRSRVLNGIRDEARQASPAAAAPPAMLAKRSWIWNAGWAVAAGLAVAAFLSYQGWRTAQHDLAQAQQRLNLAQSQIVALSKDADRSRKLLSVLMARDARFVKLSTAQQQPTLRAFWSGPTGLVLAGLNVPRPASGRTLQLWIVPKQGNPISVGLMDPNEAGEVLLIADSVSRPEDAAALAISDEPAGGSPQPTTKPAYVGPVGD